MTPATDPSCCVIKRRLCSISRRESHQSCRPFASCLTCQRRALQSALSTWVGLRGQVCWRYAAESLLQEPRLLLQGTEVVALRLAPCRADLRHRKGPEGIKSYPARKFKFGMKSISECRKARVNSTIKIIHQIFIHVSIHYNLYTIYLAKKGLYIDTYGLLKFLNPI